MIGEVLGSYRVLKLIGEGGMGRVYLAEHSLIGKRVAIKVLLPHFCNNQTIVSRFFNEARATAQIKHPSLIEIYDFGHHTSGSAFIVMEYLEGESLTHRLEQAGTLQLALAVEIARQVASALQAAHAKSIVHRDLKPDNVFLLPERDIACGLRAKVLDFGIAKLADDGGSSVKTRTGTLMGTPVYMSPEQCRGAGAVDHRTDIYSLGCLIFEMLAGRPPFVGEGPGDVIAMHLYQTPPSLAQLAPAIDPLVQRMLAKKPQDRPASLGDVLGELDGLSRARPASGAFGTVQAPTTMMPAVTHAIPSVVSTTLGGAAAELRGSAGQLRGAPASTGPRRALVAVGSAVAALAIGAGLWGLRARGSAPDPAADASRSTAASAPRATEPPAIATAAVAASRPEPAKKITHNVESQPDGAAVYRDGALLGTTPLAEMLAPRAGDARYVLKLSGYRDAQVSLPSDRDGSKTVTLSRAAAAAKPEAHKIAAKPEPRKDAPRESSRPASKPVKNGVLDPFDN